MLQLQDQIEQYYKSIQDRIDDLEPGKLRMYKSLMERQNDLRDRIGQLDSRLQEVNAEIRQFENDEQGGYSHRKQYADLEKQVVAARKKYQTLNEELDIASLDPKEAHSKFSARVQDFKQSAKAKDEQANQLRDEIRQLKLQLDELSSVSAQTEEDSNEAAKYELLVKRDQEMTAFMDNFDETRNGIIAEQQNAKSLIVGLLEHIGRGIEDSTNMPSVDEKSEMENARDFKARTLESAQRTMEGLKNEKKKREKDLEILRTSEPKIIREMNGLKESMNKMTQEIREFENIEAVQKEFDRTQNILQEQKKSYIKRRDSIRQLNQALTSDHEALKKQLAANDTDRALEEFEKRLKLNESTIFKLKESIDHKVRETDYELLKATCLKMSENLNAQLTKKQQLGIAGAGAKW